MGNQTTSGIVEEAKATNEAAEKSPGASSPDELREKNHKQIQEGETKDFQEKAAESDSHDAEADKSEEEEHKGSVDEDCKTQTDFEPKESNWEEERSKFNNEEQDQLCVLKGEMQNSNPNFTSTITNLNSTSCDADDIASEIQDDQNMLEKEIVDSSDHDVEKKEDDLVVADTASLEDALLETCSDEAELGKNDDDPQDEQSNSFNTPNDLQNISLLDSSAAENEKENECWSLVEEKLVLDELGNDDDDDNTSCVDQTQPSDQEINQFLISRSNAPPEMIMSDIKIYGEEYAVEIDSFSGLEKVDLLDEVKTIDESIPREELKDIGSIQMEGSIAVTDNQEDDELADEIISGKAVLREGELPAIENDYEKAETGTALEDSEFEAQESTEKLDSESNSRYIGVEVELRKSPSFDFGLSFDKRSEESDQTPLLYQERTPMRSFSSCSNLRFHSRSVQTEYVGKSLQYEAVEVEEKTIRVERSNSESSKAPPLHSLNKEGKADVITKAKQENFSSDKKQENGLMASPSRDNDAPISPKVNGKRKPRSSLFTTCICCTAAIS